MILLPCFFFFGFDRAGYGSVDPIVRPIVCSAEVRDCHRLINQLGTGVYLASLLKDLVCSPRPFAPPVTRLSKSSMVPSQMTITS